MLEEPTYTTSYEAIPKNNVILWARVRSWFVSFALIAVDYAAVVLAVCTAYFIRGKLLPLFYQEFFIPEVYRFIVIPLAFIFFLHFDRLSIRKLFFWQQAERLCKASVYAMLLVLVILYFTGSVHEISRIFMLLSWMFSFAFLAIGRYILKRIVTAVGILQVPTVIVGAGKTAELIIQSFQQNMGSGYKIVGLIEDDPQVSAITQKYPIIGTFAEAEDAVRRVGVRNVLIAAPGLVREDLLKLVYRLQPHVDHITFVPDLFGVPVGSMELETLFNEKTVLLKIRNNLSQVHNRIFKWIFDCLCSLLGIVVVMPVFVVLSILIYLDSPGPVVFAHRRVGQKGELFPCYKFRTMVENSEAVLEKYLANHPKAQAELGAGF